MEREKIEIELAIFFQELEGKNWGIFLLQNNDSLKNNSIEIRENRFL